MAILNAPTGFVVKLDRLVDYARNSEMENADKLKEEIIAGIVEEINRKSDADARRKLFKILKISYDGDFANLKTDVAKIALLDLDSIVGLDKVQRFLYAVWENCISDSKEEFLQSLEGYFGKEGY